MGRRACRVIPVFLTLCSIASVCYAASDDALITAIPGFNDAFPSKHYSGYVTIDETTGKRLFYYFVQSEGNASTDPVVLWLNGGPGCSSFDGFIYEHGPFNFEATEDLPLLHLNKYSWSKVSNILYLDSPAGVGLSYSNNESDYTTGDRQTASDTHIFLLKWFEMYPEFLANPFYISGESYAGVYVPTLAHEVVKGIDSATTPIINFQGYLIGNGVTDCKFDGNALVPFAHGMGLISNELFQDVNTACNGTFYGNLGDDCKDKLNKVDQDISELNIYDILEPCYHDNSARDTTDSKIRMPSSFKNLGVTDRPLPVRKRIFGRSWPFRAPVREGRVPSWPELLKNLGSVPCTDDSVATLWLNNEAVRKAIHADDVNVTGAWEICTDRINFYHDTGSMIKYHRNLTMRGYRSLIFSGDHDMCVPFTGSQAWTAAMGYKIIDEWRPWFSGSNVAGYTQSYENNLTFVTIMGAGHTVPEYKPREALDFYSRFLSGQQI